MEREQKYTDSYYFPASFVAGLMLAKNTLKGEVGVEVELFARVVGVLVSSVLVPKKTRRQIKTNK